MIRRQSRPHAEKKRDRWLFDEIRTPYLSARRAEPSLTQPVQVPLGFVSPTVEAPQSAEPPLVFPQPAKAEPEPEAPAAPASFAPLPEPEPLPPEPQSFEPQSFEPQSFAPQSFAPQAAEPAPSEPEPLDEPAPQSWQAAAKEAERMETFTPTSSSSRQGSQNSPWRKIRVSPKDLARADRSGVFRYAAASTRTELPVDDAEIEFPQKKEKKEKPAPRARQPKRDACPLRQPRKRYSSVTAWTTTAAIVGLSVAGVLGLSIVYSPGANFISRAATMMTNSSPAVAPMDGFTAIEATPSTTATMAPPQPSIQSASRPSRDALIEVAP